MKSQRYEYRKFVLGAIAFFIVMAYVVRLAFLQLGDSNYKESADIAKTAIKTGQSVRDVLKSKGLFSDEEVEKILDPQTMV